MMPPPMQVVQDPSRTAGRVIERALVYTLDCEPIDPAMEGSVKDLLLCGRGVTRIHHDPGVDESGQPTGMPSVAFELVPWEDFRHGPALRWADVEWMAVRKRLTREQIVKLNPEIGEDMSLDAWVPGSEKRQPSGGEGAAPPDVMKRGTVWEIWDKASKRVYFVAPASPEAPLAVVPDPLGLKAFFPYPEPIYAIRSSGSLVPVEPYRLYKGLATELEDLSNRIAKLVRALKWRGAYLDVSQGDFLARFEKLADGEMTPIENPAAMSSASGGALDKAFWFMPIDVLVKVLEQLYLAREQVKQSIYEVTGISDILRGASKAEETATAQNIKQQWGSLRVQKMQTEVARMARDLIRLAAEIVCEKYPPELLAAMTGMQEEMTPEVAQLLRSDAARTFRIDIETDSTIKADLQRVQQNVSGFVQGLGGFITAVAPAVQGGLMPMPLVAEMIATFARAFRLPGRKLEEMLDALPAMAAQMPPPVQPNPQADAKAQADHDMAKTHAEIGSKERIAKMGIDAEGARHRQTLQMEQQKRMSEQPDIMAAVASERAVAAVAQQMLAAATAASQASEQQAQMVEQAVSTIEQATAHIMMPRRVQRDGAGRPTALSPVPM